VNKKSRLIKEEGDGASEAQSTNNIHMIYHYSKALFNAFQEERKNEMVVKNKSLKVLAGNPNSPF
jgi:hypothetical protein